MKASARYGSIRQEAALSRVRQPSATLPCLRESSRPALKRWTTGRRVAITRSVDVELAWTPLCVCTTCCQKGQTTDPRLATGETRSAGLALYAFGAATCTSITGLTTLWRAILLLAPRSLLSGYGCAAWRADSFGLGLP